MKTYLCLAAAALAVSARAADAATRIEKDVAYLAPSRAEQLDIYHPAGPAPAAGFPAVVWIHGGGWTGGTKNEARANEVCTTLANAGYLALSIDYRLGDNAWPTSLHDAKNAIRFVRAHAKELRVDPERIAVAGGSAGGHLSLMVAFTAGDARYEPGDAATPYPGVSSAVRCAIDLYGIGDLVTAPPTAGTRPTATRVLMEKSFKAFGAKNADDEELFRSVSPIRLITKNAPPVLIAHGDADTTVDFAQSERLARALQEAGVRYEFIGLHGVGHTFNFERVGSRALPRDLRPDVLAFLAKYLATKSTKTAEN